MSDRDRTLYRLLSKADWQVARQAGVFAGAAHDLRGSGRSSTTFSSYQPEDAAKDALAVAEAAVAAAATTTAAETAGSTRAALNSRG